MPLTSAQLQLVTAALKVGREYLAARATEQNTHIGAIGAAIAYQPIADGLSDAALAILAKDYPTALAKGLPALLGVFGIIGAIATPQSRSISATRIDAESINHFSAQVSNLTGKCESS